jgi:hypothetical protein
MVYFLFVAHPSWTPPGVPNASVSSVRQQVTAQNVSDDLLVPPSQESPTVPSKTIPKTPSHAKKDSKAKTQSYPKKSRFKSGHHPRILASPCSNTDWTT